MNIYRHTPHDWPEHETVVATVLADMATGYILNAGELEARTLAQQLQHALNSRIIVEQAKGILAERNQIPPPRPSSGCASTPATPRHASTTSRPRSSTAPRRFNAPRCAETPATGDRR